MHFETVHQLGSDTVTVVNFDHVIYIVATDLRQFCVKPDGDVFDLVFIDNRRMTIVVKNGVEWVRELNYT